MCPEAPSEGDADESGVDAEPFGNAGGNATDVAVIAGAGQFRWLS